MQIRNIGKLVQYGRNQFVNVGIAHESGKIHLVVGTIAKQRQRKIDRIGFYFGWKPVYIRVGFCLVGTDE